MLYIKLISIEASQSFGQTRKTKKLQFFFRELKVNKTTRCNSLVHFCAWGRSCLPIHEFKGIRFLWSCSCGGWKKQNNKCMHNKKNTGRGNCWADHDAMIMCEIRSLCRPHNLHLGTMDSWRNWWCRCGCESCCVVYHCARRIVQLALRSSDRRRRPRTRPDCPGCSHRSTTNTRTSNACHWSFDHRHSMPSIAL